MKHLIKISLCLLCLSFAFVSCKEKSSATKGFATQQHNLAKDLQKVTIAIEGMTCEMGCKTTIENTLNKLEGVNSAKVDFPNKKGEITYDANVISKAMIIASVNDIAEGKLYKATEAKSCSAACKAKCDSLKKSCKASCAAACAAKKEAKTSCKPECKKACEAKGKKCDSIKACCTTKK